MRPSLPLGFSLVTQHANLACAFLLISGMEESTGLYRQNDDIATQLSVHLVSVSEWQRDWFADLECVVLANSECYESSEISLR